MNTYVFTVTYAGVHDITKTIRIPALNTLAAFQKALDLIPPEKVGALRTLDLFDIAPGLDKPNHTAGE